MGSHPKTSTTNVGDHTIVKTTRKNIIKRIPLEDGKIDDSVLQGMFNPYGAGYKNKAGFNNKNQALKDDYNQLKQTEKLIVNLIQCLMGYGDKIFVEALINHVTEAYLVIDKRHKFVNKGLLYLIQLYEKNVDHVLKQTKGRMLEEKKKTMMSKNATQKISKRKVTQLIG